MCKVLTIFDGVSVAIIRRGRVAYRTLWVVTGVGGTSREINASMGTFSESRVRLLIC